MRYCKVCVQPDTRPGIFFSDDGICGACLYEQEKAGLDRERRKTELLAIAEQVKSKATVCYDFVVCVYGSTNSPLHALHTTDEPGLHSVLGQYQCRQFKTGLACR